MSSCSLWQGELGEGQKGSAICDNLEKCMLDKLSFHHGHWTRLLWDPSMATTIKVNPIISHRLFFSRRAWRMKTTAQTVLRDHHNIMGWQNGSLHLSSLTLVQFHHHWLRSPGACWIISSYFSLDGSLFELPHLILSRRFFSPFLSFFKAFVCLWKKNL